MKRMQCPICATRVAEPVDNPFFPFCGRRCRGADLARWLDGSYHLGGEAELSVEAADARHPVDRVGLSALALLIGASLWLAAPSAAQTVPQDAGAPSSDAASPTAPDATAPDAAAGADPAAVRPHDRRPARTSTPAAPPPDVAPPAAQQQAAQEAHEDESDHGVVYIGADFGYSWINLVQFSSNNFIPAAQRHDGSGWTTALSAGFRIFWFTAGARGTLSSYPGFEIGTVGLDLAVHLPIPVVEPYVRGGLAYGWMGSANYGDPNKSETTVTGLVGELGAGLDLYLNDHVSIGAGVDASFLNLTRQKVTTGAVTGVTDINVSENGDAVGLQLRFHGQLTLHI